MSLHSPATGVSITNNPYNPADSVFYAYGTAGLWLNVGSLNGMTVDGNEWGPLQAAIRRQPLPADAQLRR